MNGFEQARQDGLFTNPPYYKRQKYSYSRKKPLGKPLERFLDDHWIDDEGIFVSNCDGWFIGFPDCSYACSFSDTIGSVYMKSPIASIRAILRTLYKHKIQDNTFRDLYHPEFLDCDWKLPPVSVFDTETAKQLDNWVIKTTQSWGAYYDPPAGSTLCNSLVVEIHHLEDGTVKLEPESWPISYDEGSIMLRAALRTTYSCIINGVRFWGYLSIDAQNVDWEIWIYKDDKTIDIASNSGVNVEIIRMNKLDFILDMIAERSKREFCESLGNEPLVDSE